MQLRLGQTPSVHRFQPGVATARLPLQSLGMVYDLGVTGIPKKRNGKLVNKGGHGKSISCGF
jgi:hypothetical protein